VWKIISIQEKLIDNQERKITMSIVVHVHSPGGSGYSMQLLISMYSLVNVPICSMVDGYSASAATGISVLAPYRVAASQFSWTLIHDISYISYIYDIYDIYIYIYIYI
jgi:ClpP class serine protease